MSIKPKKKRKKLLENKIYASVIGFCEYLENKKIYRGNGHHLAQKLTGIVSAGLLSKPQQKIYSIMEESYLSTRIIALRSGMPSKLVSAMLHAMQRDTLLISCKKQGRLKSWCRNHRIEEYSSLYISDPTTSGYSKEELETHC